MKYCTIIPISEHIRLDLFTAEMFRVRQKKDEQMILSL